MKASGGQTLIGGYMSRTAVCRRPVDISPLIAWVQPGPPMLGFPRSVSFLHRGVTKGRQALGGNKQAQQRVSSRKRAVWHRPEAMSHHPDRGLASTRSGCYGHQRGGPDEVPEGAEVVTRARETSAVRPRSRYLPVLTAIASPVVAET